nr:hypothetical protein [Acidobacteriota bacterium]
MPSPVAAAAAALTLTVCLLAAAGSSAARPAAAPRQLDLRYIYLLAGNRAGAATVRTAEDGGLRFTFEFNDRGRGPELAAHVLLDAKGLPVLIDTTGHDYWKSPVAEHFELAQGKASWKNASEKGEKEVSGRAFYLTSNATPPELGLLARALRASRGGQLALLPDGLATLEKAGSTQVTAAGLTRAIELYAITGLDFSPTYVWLDTQGELFASVSGWATVILEGWEGVIPRLATIQSGAELAWQRRLAAQLARRPPDHLVLRGAKLFDAASKRSEPGMTVVVAGDHIESVGKDGLVAIPAHAEVIDAAGKALLPGLWDMHVHLGPNDGILNLAAGVTSVRDMANDIDELGAMRRRFDTGEAIGPRVLMAGFIDGPGPYAGPSKVLVSTEKEAVAAVDRYAHLGYSQIKLYSSLDPQLVPPIVRHAHELGLRVSGHIPNGLSAEQAVRLGFNEIQHANFLFLNFIPGIDTRTPARFSAVAEHAAELDLGSEKVRDFLRLLKERGVAVDPTLNIFETLFEDRPGQLSRGMAAVADRLPPQLRRGLYGGGGLAVPPGMDERYHASF